MDKEQYEILYRMEERHWWYLGMRRIVGALLPSYLKGRPRPRILDAGCGTGGMLTYLERFGPTVGVDLSEEAIAFCRQRHLASVVRGSVEDLPFAAETFDLVMSFDVLYHRAVGNDCRALEEFRRVLKPGGLTLIRVPAYDWLRGAHDVAVHTRHRYARRELTGKLEEAGFRVERVTYVDALLFPIAAAKRLVEGDNPALKPDLALPPAPLNRALLGVLSLESAVLPFVSFPWGLSLLAVATKADSH